MCAECHSTGVQKNSDAATIALRRNRRRSASAAKRVTGPAPVMSHGRRMEKAGGPGATGRPDQRPPRAVRRASRHNLDAERKDRDATAQRHAAGSRKKSNVPVCVTHGARNSRRNGSRTAACQHTSADADVSHTVVADGQMRDIEELYSDLPSSRARCSLRVTCSDCHAPHSAALRAPGDGVCLQCHTPDKYRACHISS